MSEEENPRAGAGIAGSGNRQEKYIKSDHQVQLCATAIQYAEYGWHVFPVHGIANKKCTCKGINSKCSPGKHPLTSNGFKDATTNPNTIHDWWNKWPYANIGIRTGAESQLWVLDVDWQHGGFKTLHTLMEKHGKLPKTLVVRTGGGGLHLYFRHPGFRIASRQGIEPGLDVRADDGYVVAPPSRHMSGSNYAWKIHTEIAEAPSWLLEIVTQRIQRELRSTEDMEEKEESKVIIDTNTDTGAGSGRSPFSEKEANEIIETTFQATQPTKLGERNDLVFLFARHLKAIAALSEAPASELKPLVRKWHEKALPYIGTKPFTATWADFVRDWGDIRFPFGEDPMLKALENAKKATLPPEVIDMEIDCPKAQLLAAICRELQRAWRNHPFFLSCRKAGELIEVTHKTASNYLNMFVEEKLLELVEKGGESNAVRRASRYRYLGALDR